MSIPQMQRGLNATIKKLRELSTLSETLNKTAYGGRDALLLTLETCESRLVQYYSRERAHTESQTSMYRQPIVCKTCGHIEGDPLPNGATDCCARPAPLTLREYVAFNQGFIPKKNGLIYPGKSRRKAKGA